MQRPKPGLAADGGDDGSFFFQFGKGLVDILAVKASDFCNLSCIHGRAELAHGFQYLLFHVIIGLKFDAGNS